MKISKRYLLILLMITFGLFTFGCASTASKWNSSSINQIKNGIDENEVVTLLGEPTSRSIDNAGNSVLEYVKASSGGFNTLAKIGSYGMLSGANSLVVDILTVTFVNGKVDRVKYAENVSRGTGMPGM